MKKNIFVIQAMLLLMLAALVACQTTSSGEEQRETEASAEESVGENTAESTTYEPVSWSDEDATVIVLDGVTARIDGGGAAMEEGNLMITGAGTYVLSGRLDGQVVVETTKDDTVTLVLNGVEINSSVPGGINAVKADTTILVLAEGTENSVTDSGAEVAEDHDEPDAAVFAKDDLVISGTGSLTVTGNYNNGIGSKDDLVIESGNISVTASNHGIRGRDSLTVLDGNFIVVSGNDGLQSNNDSGEDKGWILLEGGRYNITAENDGIQAETALTINGGEYTIVSGGGHDATVDTDGSYKGLKAGTDLTVNAGDFDLDCADDTVHANGNVTVNGGTFLLASGDDGMHADAALTINDGEIEITISYEGLEGATVDINGGSIRLVATDDGINAAGGNDSGSRGPRFGGDSFADGEEYYISISGGQVVVSAAGDGIDSNGNVYMSGGTLLVNGPTSGGDAPLDFDGAFTLTGGTIVATGSSGMAQAPGTVENQAVLQIYFTQTLQAGTPLHVADADGNPVLTFVPQKDYQNAVITSPALTAGGTYQVYTGGSDSGLDENGYAADGAGYADGTLLVEVVLEEAVTRINESGEAVSGGMFGGMMGGGGPGGRGGFGGGTPPSAPPGGDGDGSRGERQPPQDGEPPSGGPGGERPDRQQ